MTNKMKPGQVIIIKSTKDIGIITEILSKDKIRVMFLWGCETVDTNDIEEKS